uniref:Putative secreted peptide n=1 Tax=Rhipicephalus pulchellus TaxID=72859 RepID=L7MBY6_RHIPC
MPYFFFILILLLLRHTFNITKSRAWLKFSELICLLCDTMTVAVSQELGIVLAIPVLFTLRSYAVMWKWSDWHTITQRCYLLFCTFRHNFTGIYGIIRNLGLQRNDSGVDVSCGDSRYPVGFFKHAEDRVTQHVRYHHRYNHGDELCQKSRNNHLHYCESALFVNHGVRWRPHW